MRIREEKHWSSCSVREMCIKYDLYTYGDNEEYSKMLDYVHYHDNPSNDDIYEVAKDIVNHCDPKDGYNIESVMYLLTKEAIESFYFI